MAAYAHYKLLSASRPGGDGHVTVLVNEEDFEGEIADYFGGIETEPGSERDEGVVTMSGPIGMLDPVYNGEQ